MRTVLVYAATSIAALSYSFVAVAQEAPASTGPAPSTTSPATSPQTDTLAGDAGNTAPENQLGDIVVTAQRRAENLQRAAVAVDVVSAEGLLKNGITDPTALGSLVPALTVTSTAAGRSSFFVRGVGNFTANPLFDSAIAFNFDGVYIGKPGSTSGFFYDLERIEVLKGPQGTLYGRNATGGAINVLPVRPKIGQASGYLTGSYGNYNAVNLEGAVNAPLGSHAALRISGMISDRDGYLSDGTSDERMGALRVQLLGELTPELTVRVSADYEHSGGRGTGANYVNAYRYDAATARYIVTPSNLGASVGIFDPRAQAFRRTLRAGPAGRNLVDLQDLVGIDNDSYGAHAEINYDTGVGTLTVIPAWRRANQGNNSDTNGFLAEIEEIDNQYSLEARFVGTRVGPIDYTLGAFYFSEHNYGHQAIGQQALVNVLDVNQRTKSYAGFARVTGHVSDRLRLVGGIRYTADRKSFNGTGDSLVIVCTQAACPTAPLFPFVDRLSQLTTPVPPSGGVVPLIGTGAIIARAPQSNVDIRAPKDRVTYRGAVEFDIADRSLLYASIETGFRSGGFSLATGYEIYNPEYLTAYTIGSKNRFFANRLQLNLEGFYWKYKDQQLATVALDRIGRQGLFTQNIGRSTMYGVDAEARLLVTPTTILNGQVQYLHTKYDSFTYQVPIGNAPPFTTCAVSIDTVNPAFRNVDCSGNPTFNSPRWTVNLGGDQTINLGHYKFVGSVDTQFRSSRVVGFDFQPGQRVGSTWTTNAQLSFGPEDDAWSIAGYVRNIENDRYAVMANSVAIGNALVAVTAPPRTYGVRGSFKF